MKGRTWEGGLRVPMIARWPGKIPAGLVNDSLAGTIDVFPTILKAAGVNVPKDRVIDGKNIWPLLTSARVKSPHEALFAMQGVNLYTVRSGKWKLHVRSPGGVPKRGEDWVDPRGPDGVTIIAPYEQARPSAYPGVTGGDGPKDMMLFDIEADPAEQHDVARQHPDVVKRLKALYEKTVTQVPSFKRPKRFKQLRRIKGGSLELRIKNLECSILNSLEGIFSRIQWTILTTKGIAVKACALCSYILQSWQRFPGSD